MRAVSLPVFVFLFSYAATTVFGATLLLTPFGARHFQYFMGTDAIRHMGTIGSPFYWALLLMPFCVVPLGAVIGQRLTGRVLGIRGKHRLLDYVWLPGAAVLLALGTLYCVYKLRPLGGLVPIGAIDAAVCVEEKIVRRAELIRDLGNRPYFFLNGVLPVLSALFLAQFLERGDRVALALYGLCAVIAVWLCLAVFMKAPLIIFVVAGLCAALAAGVRWTKAVPGFLLLAVAVYAVLSLAQMCKVPPVVTDVVTAPRPKSTASAASTASPATSAEQEIPIRHDMPEAEGETPTQRFAVKMVRDLAFRIAAAFPYYVETFSDPEERCGIWIPRVAGKCFAPLKGYRAAYPYNRTVAGYLPAPVNASGLAEAGPAWAVLATLIAGIVIGILSALFAGVRSPLAAAIAVAACIYAYYVSQASLTGSFVDSYGLVWTLGTVALVIALTKLVRGAGVASSKR